MDFYIPNKERDIPVLHNDANAVSQNGYKDTQQIARLFIFSPRSFIDTCKRTQKYNFDINFLDDIKDNIDKLVNGSAVTMNVESQSYMNNYPSATQAVSVDPVGMKMDNSKFEEYATFILQIDNEQLGVPTYNGPFMKNRMVFSGFCINEPVHTNGVTNTINPNCRLKFTHHTSMSKVSNNLPTLTDMMRVQADVDYLIPDITQLLNNDVNYLVTPESICTEGNIDEELNFNIGSQSRLTSYGSSPIPMNTTFNSPKHSLKSMVGSILKSFNDTSLDYITSGDIRTSNLSNPFGMSNSTQNLRQSFMSNLDIKVADPLISIDGTDCPTISYLQSKYPNLQVEVFHADKLDKGDLADQTIPTPVNVGSSIVVSSVPMLLNDAGLCEIAYRYISHKPTALFDPNNFNTGGIQDTSETKIFHVASWVAESERIIKLRLRAFLSQMKNQVYPLLKDIAGDFSLEISCNSMGECVCVLRYLDNADYMDGFYESPLLLGGLNSPLLGSEEIYKHNVMQMSNLMTSLSMDVGNLIPNIPNLFGNLNYADLNPNDIRARSERYAQEFFGNQKF